MSEHIDIEAFASARWPNGIRKDEQPEWARRSARSHLRQLCYDANTLRCAEGFNTPMWQRAAMRAIILNDRGS